MIKYKKYVFIGLTLIAAGCSNQPIIGMANPASVYCEEVGGKNIVKDGAGYCQLPGRTVEAWDLYQAKDRFNKP